LRRSAESEALDLKLHQATAASLASDQESSLQSLRLARQLAVSENETLRPLIDQARHELAAQLTVNAALLGAVQLRDTTLEGLRTQLASAEAECQSVSQLLARQDEERKRLTEVQTALAEAEARCASSQAEADAARLQLESVQTQRMDFDAALMLKEAQANAWERECRNAKNRADTAVRKSATDAQALESLKAELAACQTELAAVNGAPTASAAPTADPALAQRMKDLETELAVVSESHARLESELAESKALASRAEDLSEQLGTVEAELAALKLEPPPSPSGDLETLLQDLDTLTRERNQLAAEVASLKATGTRPDSV
jgi:chromosome segregation ATPase